MYRLFMLGFMALLFNSVAIAEEIRVEGGGAATSAVFSPVKESYEEETGDTLIVKKTTPVEGLIALEKGLADIATAAVPLKELIGLAAKEGVKIDPNTLKASVIANNSTLVFINKPSRVDTLSKKQLKEIFTGKITNWREVGGDDLPIDVIWGDKTPGQNALFTKLILDGEAVTAKATPATNYEDIRKLVMKRPGAIGIDPKGFKMGGVKVPTTPSMVSSIIVITKGDPSAKVKKVLDYIALASFELGH